MNIDFYNRYTGNIEQEKVYGAAAVEWLYKSYLGGWVNDIAVSRPVSKLYGWLQDLPSSRFKIAQFCEDFDIDLDDFLPEQGASRYHPYSTFNAFFIRRWKEGKRIFDSKKEVFPAFVEGRYLGFNHLDQQKIPVKGIYTEPLALLANNRWNSFFKGGNVLIGRLCPVDYHRFHFPVDGEVVDQWTIPGKFHSVNPIALENHPDIFLQNERQITIIKTEDFGYLAYIEVGATCVGKIVQTYQEKNCFRSQEKGYFLFGGSTVIVLGEPNIWELSDDICQNSLKGIETYVHLGDIIGQLKR